MMLFRQCLRHLRWFSSVWQRLLRHTPFAAPATAFMLLVSQLAQVVAFLLPLKVILLLGGDGIPRYFRGFVSLETKELWIVLLCLGAVSLYALSQLMDWLADRQSRKGALVVLDKARKITMFNDQGEGVREQYRRICEVVSDGASFIVGILVGLLIFPTLFLFLSLVIVGMATLVFMATDFSGSEIGDRLERWLNINSRGLLRVMGSLGFLAGFLFLVWEFYRVDDLNLLIGIISLILSRRIFQALVNFINGQVKLAQQHGRVDALFFHEKQLQSEISRKGQRFWQLFTPEARLPRSVEWLNKGDMQVPSYSLWVDNGQANIAWFELNAEKEASRCVLEKIHFSRQRSQGNHEVYLLKRIDLRALQAPRLLGWGELEEFLWIQLACPAGQSVERADWGNIQRKLVLDLWAYVPPDEVMDSFLRSQPPLWSRVDADLIDSLTLAAESGVEKQLLNEFQARLADMQQRLKRVPLFIYNPDLNERNVRTGADGTPCILTWGRWCLEPVGVGACSRYLELARKGGLVDELRTRRRLPTKLTDRDLLLAAGMHELERMIRRQQYRQALHKMQELLDDTHFTAMGDAIQGRIR